MHLTAREREVLDLLKAGMKPSQIAVRLTISPSTVKTHTRNIAIKANREGEGLLAIATAAARGDLVRTIEE